MHPGQPIEPALHIFAMRLSYRLVGIIQATLRPEEIHAAATEFYQAIVDDARDYEQKNGRRMEALHSSTTGEERTHDH